MNKTWDTWDKEIETLSDHFECGLKGDRIIQEVKQLPDYEKWSDEKRYKIAWRKLVDVL